MFALAISPGAFGDSDLVLRGIRENLARVHSTPPTPGFSEVQVPGDYERRSRESSPQNGVEVLDLTWGRIVEVAESVGVAHESLRAEAQGH